ncbi:UDP-glucose 4-epimerase GalE [Aminobacter sp. HY435]|uniref:UDP-glucose 4-epimerase GalE n=1 Tax=Aminobacter sp. HY435 TaxID=2970917 RepID=UPI0022B9B156|nr:UDP-glucose 4-epimerase GalE [Aminobacter sp. HY435]
MSLGKDILVVGGGGYIGSHTCLDLANRGFRPIVYDNFSNGHREFVKWGPLEEGDIRDRARLDEVFAKYRPAAVVHFAALIEVGQSVKDPISFFENNVAGSLSLLAAAKAADCRRLVFSSTCATYGDPEETPMRESHRQVPINPYGRSKLIVEEMLRELDRYEGFRSVSLRYFNAAGADPEGRIGERHDPETHAIPLAIDAALGRRAGFSVFGDDYDTRDGSCVRDFVHVMDLADAHSRAVQYLIDGGDSIALNLGTGQGTTVKELLSTVRRISGRDFRVEQAPRRAGDAPALVADNAMALKVLGWTPRHDLNSIVSTAWNWHARSNVE